MHKIEEPEEIWLTREQFEKLHAELPPHLQLAAEFAALTGLRMRAAPAEPRVLDRHARPIDDRNTASLQEGLCACRAPSAQMAFATPHLGILDRAKRRKTGELDAVGRLAEL
jgi:hypothetical protein